MCEGIARLSRRKSGRRSSCLLAFDTTGPERSVATSKYLERYTVDNTYAYNYPKELIAEFQQWIEHAKSFSDKATSRDPAKQHELSPYDLLNDEQKAFFRQAENYVALLESAKVLVHSVAGINRNEALLVQNAIKKMKEVGDTQNRSVVHLLKG